MRILVLSSYKDSWNSVRPEAEMFIEMVNQGHDVTIMTQGDAEYVSRFKKYGIHVIDCYPKRKICSHTIKAIRTELKAKYYDIVYALNSKTIPNAAFACIGFPNTKLISYRGTVGGIYRHDPSAYLTHLHPRIDGISCVANAVTESVRTKAYVDHDAIQTIYKGHDLEWYVAEKANREILGLLDSDVVVICVANARKSKGVHILLEAMTHLASISNLHLVLVGRDMDTEENTQLAQQSGMNERIHFLGYRNDVPELMAMADIQIQPSISGEGLPKTIIEAMAMSKPSVVTTTGGSKELVDNNVTGFVVETGNEAVLANKIAQLAQSKEMRTNMGNAAKQRLIDSFSIQATTLQQLAFFQHIKNKA
ncbi:glycosyltransferase [Photobacterium damselae subsp. damselae]|uniref:glycosyltransferase n=1 Tax=Photobacterium damselae TaxID=38293 RepID=UPI001F2D4BAF|nr:glycosyltransferase [Photobacterium damselae]UJZ94020.1 glycosyltransferase [Photobacterium damselae subsp. damselae]UJZ98001.1 glycosyltransferase [Photobacterium damselae subsp. damselae]